MKFLIILKHNYKFRFNSDNEGTKVPDITRNNDKIYIHCSLVVSSIVNGNTNSDVICSFAPKTEPRALLCEISIERQYLAINRNKYINVLKMTITD